MRLLHVVPVACMLALSVACGGDPAGSVTSPSPSLGTVQGSVRDFDTQAPVPSAMVVINRGADRVAIATNPGGFYRVLFSAGPFVLRAYKESSPDMGRGATYEFLSTTISTESVQSGGTTTVDVQIKRPLAPVPWTLAGTVIDGLGAPLSGARVTITEVSIFPLIAEQITGTNGRYAASSNRRTADDMIRVVVLKDGYRNTPARVMVCCGAAVDFRLVGIVRHVLT